MTPATKSLEAAQIAFELLEYRSTGGRDIGRSAALALNLDTSVVFKTLVAELNTGGLAVAVIPVSGQLDLKCLARAANTKSASMASAEQAEKATGYVTGGISPIGQKRLLPTYLAEQATAFEQIYVSAGKRGLELALSPADLIRITEATVCRLTR